MATKKQAQDWPNLSKYQQENSLLPIPVLEEKRVVFIGDSITEFWKMIDPDYFVNKSYINRGISGQTTPQMLVRFRADVIALQPTVVIILAGINDIAGNTGPSSLEMIRDNIFSMVELAKANQIEVILCSVLPAIDFSWKPNQQPIEKIKALNEIIKNYTQSNDIVYIDYYSVMVDAHEGLKKEYSNDGVHPNKMGYQVMRPLTEKAIAYVLKSDK